MRHSGKLPSSEVLRDLAHHSASTVEDDACLASNKYIPIKVKLSCLLHSGRTCTDRSKLNWVVQGALPAFVGICEAVTSWRHIRDEGLLNEMIQIMQLYKQHLTAGGMWQQALNSLPRAVRDKLTTLCHL